jgi:cytochrome c-type biogenesis protein CcmH
MKFFLYLILLLTFMGTTCLGAATDIYSFDSPAQAKRFEKLGHEFRCVVCQNETLADSNAPLAKDLRFQIYTMVKQNKDNDEIVKFLTQRYGDFVLFRPRFSSSNLWLWIGPFVMLLFALARLYWLLLQRQKKQRSATYTFSKQDRERIRHLLSQY